MTADLDEVRARTQALRRGLERDKRDRLLRAGLAKPRNQRETALFLDAATQRYRPTAAEDR